jgi:hypothetical protein
MRNPKNFLPQCLLVLALFAHGAAQALPVFHVSLDTTAYTGQGLMDFTFLANAGATPATAVVSNFVGAFGATFDRSAGAVGAVPGPVSLSNQDGGDYLTEVVSLGGQLSFDVRFDGDFATVSNLDESQFNVTLYKDDFSDYIGPAGSFAGFELMPPANGSPGGVVVSSNELAKVAALPEPSSLLLSLSALAMLGLAARKRPRPGKPVLLA